MKTFTPIKALLAISLVLLTFTVKGQTNVFYKSLDHSQFHYIARVDSGFILGGRLWGPAIIQVDSGGIVKNIYRYDTLGSGLDHYRFSSTPDSGLIIVLRYFNTSHLLKLDKYLQPQWSKEFANRRLNHAIATNQGEIVFCGLGIIGKMDMQGTIVWSRAYSNPQQQPEFGWLNILHDGSMLVIGDDNTPSTLSNVFVMKTDSMGQVIWSKRYPPVSRATNPIVLQDGSFVLAGSYNHNIFLIKTDSMANISWVSSYDLSQPIISLRLRHLLLTSDNGFLLSGENMDAFMLKTDSLGALQWAKKYGYTAYDWIEEVIELPGQGYLAAGGSGIYLGITTGNIIKTDTNGSTDRCVHSFVPPLDTTTYLLDTITITSSPIQVLASSKMVVRVTEPLQQFQDTCVEIWISVNEVDNPTHIVYPNPSSGLLKFSSAHKIESVTIWNSLGRLILTESFYANQLEISLPHSVPGLYYYQLVFLNGNRKSGKILVH